MSNHRPWPQRACVMYCPVDRKNHRWGCQCVRDDPTLVPGSIRDWYVEQWEKMGVKYGSVVEPSVQIDL